MAVAIPVAHAIAIELVLLAVWSNTSTRAALGVSRSKSGPHADVSVAKCKTVGSGRDAMQDARHERPSETRSQCSSDTTRKSGKGITRKRWR